MKKEMTQELDISLNLETLSQMNDNVKTEEIDIDDEYLQKIKTEEVELPSNDEEITQERTENCLSEHVNGDMNEKKYDCNFCSKSFISNYNLQKHLNTHTKDEKYVCTFCQKWLNLAIKLLRGLTLQIELGEIGMRKELDVILLQLPMLYLLKCQIPESSQLGVNFSVHIQTPISGP
ncbi:uncharacterized protein LOC142334026 [Lycorma delicatula]|uniref:uncharacterized protein LOC142334026 n=1 Tax=Lycorma delicatula TaxID=130591 RepID=UPI003F50D7FA